MVETEAITRRFHPLAGLLDERARRLVAAAEALSIDWGGSIAVARATGITRRAVRSAYLTESPRHFIPYSLLGAVVFRAWR